MGLSAKASLARISCGSGNAFYLFNLILTLLFLLLPAITGPSTKIWWLTISYSTPGASGKDAGSEWNMGGLGVCKVGGACTTGSEMAPAVSGQIKSVLMYHFAVVAMVFIIAIIQMILVPRQGWSMGTNWATRILPIFATLLVCSAMAVDLIVRAHLMNDKSIGAIRTEAVFWLSVSASISSVFWAISALQMRRAHLSQSAGTGETMEGSSSGKGDESRGAAGREARQADDRNFAQRLWPWSKP